MNKLYFYGHTEKSGEKKCLSNWHPCDFHRMKTLKIIYCLLIIRYQQKRGISIKKAEEGCEWKGTNWLGECLMKVRDAIKKN